MLRVSVIKSCTQETDAYSTRKKKKSPVRKVTNSKITTKHNFQADVLDKIIDGINNPTMETGSTGFTKKNLIPYIACFKN